MADQNLTKDWIQYLKNNRIVSMQSDPKTGQLNYRRPVTAEDLKTFLTRFGQFPETQIQKAIDEVLAAKGVKQTTKKRPFVKNKGAKAFNQMATQLGALPQAPTQQPTQQPTPEGISFKNIYESVVQEALPQIVGGKASSRMAGMKTPAAQPQQQPAQQPPQQQGNGSMQDTDSVSFDEKDVQKIFAALGAMTPKRTRGAAAGKPQPETPEQQEAKKNDQLNQLRRLIRDNMNTTQRKALYRALTDNGITEAQINPHDANAIFKGAAELRSKPQGVGKFFKGLQKDKINPADLQKEWIANGRPDDERDLARILKNHGFADNEIKKVFANVFGEDDEDDDGPGYAQPEKSEKIKQIADYAKKNGMADQLKQFLEQEFGEELGVGQAQPQGFMGKAKSMWKKATMEEVRQIFEEIVKEERRDRAKLIRETEQVNLGRNTKSSIRLEDVGLNDVLRANQYVKLIQMLKVHAGSKVEVSSIKNKIIQSWKQGMKSRKHYDSLLNKINLSLNDLIDK